MWHGYYEQFGQHKMEILMRVDSNTIYGEGGHDEIGTFDINGPVNGDKFSFVKQYRGAHCIHYHGNFENNSQTMVGHWGFSQGEKQGGFKMEC